MNISSRSDALELIDGFGDSMSALEALVVSESKLIKAGKRREALRLQSAKQQSAEKFLSITMQLQENIDVVQGHVPSKVKRLKRSHQKFKDHILENLSLIDELMVSRSPVSTASLETNRRGKSEMPRLSDDTLSEVKAKPQILPNSPAHSPPLRLHANKIVVDKTVVAVPASKVPTQLERRLAARAAAKSIDNKSPSDNSMTDSKTDAKVSKSSTNNAGRPRIADIDANIAKGIK